MSKDNKRGIATKGKYKTATLAKTSAALASSGKRQMYWGPVHIENVARAYEAYLALSIMQALNAWLEELNRHK